VILRENPFTLSMPAEARFLDLQMQRGDAVMWFLVRLSNPVVEQNFKVVETGQIFPESAAYIGTYQKDGYVWHVFKGR